MASLRKRVRAFAVLTAFALMATACGEAAEVTTTSSTTTLAPVTTEPTATTTPVAEGQAPVEGAVMSVTFNVHPDATWSDGVPVTADDFQFTFDTIMNPDNDILSRSGFDQVINTEVIDDKTFRLDFPTVYAPWQALWSNTSAPIIPKHEFEGQDFNSFWTDQITLGSGPFIFDSWTKDQNIKLVRNPNYWRDTFIDGTPVGDVQEIIIPFIEESQTQVQALRGREIDMFYPQPQLDLVEQVATIDGVISEAGLGPIWEHFDFNHSDPLLSQKFIREAIAKSIDRAAIVEAIIQPLAPTAVPLNNSVWMNGTANYEDHFSQYDYDPAGAAALLESNGCAKGGDGIYECDGERLSFTWDTTAGNEARELQFEVAQQQLKEVGIEVVATFGPASEVFADENFYGDHTQWQIFNFAWVGSPDPFGANTLYHCEGDAPNGFGAINNLRYCDETVDALIRQTDLATDPAERARLYNEADELWLAEIPLIPMYQKPTFFAWYSDISGPKDNATQVGPMWNVETWAGKDTIVFGADQQPESLNRQTPDGNLFAAGLVAEAVLQSAYTITPDFLYVPNLISDAFVTLYEE